MAGGRPLSATLAWVDRHSAAAPPVLRARVRELAAGVPEGASIADTLAEAGRRTLAAVARHPGDRSAALDLLAADALVTLALLAQAEAAPGDLHRFARGVLERETARP